MLPDVVVVCATDECRAVGIKYTQEECAVILVREILPCLVELKRIR